MSDSGRAKECCGAIVGHNSGCLQARITQLETIIANQRADLRAQQNGQGWDLYNQLVKAICGDVEYPEPHNTLHKLRQENARLKAALGLPEET